MIRQRSFSGILLLTQDLRDDNKLINNGRNDIASINGEGLQREDIEGKIPCKSPCLLKEPTILEHLLSVSAANALKTMPFITLRQRKRLWVGKRTSCKKDIQDVPRLIRKAHVGREKRTRWSSSLGAFPFFFTSWIFYILFPDVRLYVVPIPHAHM